MVRAGEGSRLAMGWVMLFVQMLAPVCFVGAIYSRRKLRLFPLNDNGGRAIWLYALAVLGSFGYLIVPISEIMGEDFPCDAMLLTYFQMPLTATPVLLSVMKYHLRCQFQAQVALQAGGGFGGGGAGGGGSGSGGGTLQLDDLQGSKRTNELVVKLYLAAVCVAATACVVASQTISVYGSGEEGCQTVQWQEDAWFYFVGTLVWAAFIVLARRLRQLSQDGFGIHTEIILGACSIFTFCIVWLLTVFLGWQTLGEGKLYEQHFNPDYLQYLTFLGGFFWLTLWPVYRTYHPEVEKPPCWPERGTSFLPCVSTASATGDHSAASQDSLGGDRSNVQMNPMATMVATIDLEADITLLTIIKDPRGFNFFKSHLQTEFSVENIIFWGECEDFKTKWEANCSSDEGKKNVNTKCQWIRNTFVTEGSKLEINISNAQRSAIEASVDQSTDAAPAARDVFEEGQTEIYKLMERDSLPRFRKSPLFSKYISGECSP